MKFVMALVQAAFPFGDREANLAKAEVLVREAAKKANFICLPESFDVGFSCMQIEQMMELAQPLEDHASIRAMSSLAKELSVFLLAPVFLRQENGTVENTAVLIDDVGQIVGYYAKTHLVPGPEKDHITPGHRYPVFETKYGRIGIAICNDLTMPEVSRLLGIQGADLILIPSAWRSISDWKTQWTVMAAARAIDNQAMVAAINHVGTTDGYTYSGECLFCDTDGMILQMASREEETILYQEIDLEHIRACKKLFSTFYCDRLAEDFGLLCEKDVWKRWGEGWLV